MATKDALNLVSVTENDGPGSSEPTMYYQKREVYLKEYDPSCLQRCSNWIILALETFFYKYVSFKVSVRICFFSLKLRIIQNSSPEYFLFTSKNYILGFY